MYYLIETLDQLEEFRKQNYKEVFMEVIPFNNNIHPSQNNISLIYVRPRDISKGFMICIEHSEALPIALNLALKCINTWDKIYVRDKKETLHYFPLRQIYDINIKHEPIQLSSTVVHDIFYRKFENNPEINKIIPISKHYEICEELYNKLKRNIKKEPTEYEEFFNSRISVVFNAIERSGIRIQPEIFEQYFHPIDGEYAFTQFNHKSTNRLPANSWNGVNYAALNKDNGCRASFIPRNDLLVEMDVSAMHPSLLANLIEYKFPPGEIHQYFASLYGVSYEESKQITFRQLYGGVYEQYKHIEFFARTEKYVRNLWQEFNEKGYIKCPISNYIFRKDELENMNPQKLLNYLLQAMELSFSTLILWDTFRILRGKKTKLIHYCFDSFLFDVDKSEIKILENIINIFSQYNLNIKIKNGNNYQEMKMGLQNL